MNLFEIFRVGSQSLLIIYLNDRHCLGRVLCSQQNNENRSRYRNFGRRRIFYLRRLGNCCSGTCYQSVQTKTLPSSISVIFLFNVIAAFLFPTLGAILGFNDMGFGMWAGTAINDTSSVVAAGQTWASASGSDTALNYATIVKLTRTLAIIPICLGLAYLTSKRKATTSEVKISSIFPMFIIYF